MARKEIITVLDSKSPCFNVSHPVGVAGWNDMGDVILVQAMFRFIFEGFEDTSHLGVPSPDDVPALTGYMDGKTIKSIRSFEQRWMNLLMRPDGKIHPANYHRNLQVSGTKPRMTITMLHFLCENAAGLMNQVDYTQVMPQMFPALWTFVRQLGYIPSREELGIHAG